MPRDHKVPNRGDVSQSKSSELPATTENVTMSTTSSALKSIKPATTWSSDLICGEVLKRSLSAASQQAPTTLTIDPIANAACNDPWNKPLVSPDVEIALFNSISKRNYYMLRYMHKREKKANQKAKMKTAELERALAESESKRFDEECKRHDAEGKLQACADALARMKTGELHIDQVELDFDN